jgi:hypothetical protein
MTGVKVAVVVVVVQICGISLTRKPKIVAEEIVEEGWKV